jgi:hypothetical protein
MSPMPAKWKRISHRQRSGVRLELPDILPVAGEIGIPLQMIEIAAMAAHQSCR